MTQTPTELVPINFYGDTMEACQQDGKVWVSLRRLCENMGVSFSTQLKKVKAAEWACVAEMTTHDVTGRQQVASMIDLDTLPGWLFSVNAGKVREEVRAKLVRYQREAARVLADHFFKRAELAPAPADPILAMIETARTTYLMQIEQAKRLTAVEAKTDRALREATAARQTAECNYGWYSVLAWCNRIGRRLSVTEAARLGKELSDKLRSLGGEPQRVADPRFGHVNLYPETLLAEHVGEPAPVPA